MSIYGLIIGIALIVGIELIKKYNKTISYLDILFILLSVLIGARVLYIFHNIEEIKLGIINPIAIWDGGLAFYGGIIGLLIALLIISKYKRITFYILSDSILLFLPLIHAIGRIGNFFNYELYGLPTKLPWGIYIPEENRYLKYIEYSHFHPVYLYESILNILNFYLLYKLFKKKLKPGIITSIYLINYSIIRLLVNTLRIDKEFFWGIETSNLFSILFLIIGIIILIMITKNKTQLAHFFSKPVMIFLILLALLSLFLKIDIPIKYQITLFIFSIFLPVATSFLFRYFKLTSDFAVSEQEERPRLFFLFLILLFISFGISLKTGNTQLILIYTVINITLLCSTLLTMFWKISFHMIVATLCLFVISFLLNNPLTYLLSLALPLVGWSRIFLKRHTLKQVIGGFVITISCILFVLTFINF
ncbi:prolipoprotein diacylglyceryl transferase [Candidatus Dojkabacteria bacterium]|uniref:Prolipoprotein diacylglyceryl transferase n=1 Tax=Candidatus Dojkabacteria bacterium TaxID=2099670 RepID=A0A847ESQ9_9BACT|nr:prolipoprotein diacylglyceryl transferase [Candidatus Dojkabacteria bacterium]